MEKGNCFEKHCLEESIFDFDQRQYPSDLLRFGLRLECVQKTTGRRLRMGRQPVNMDLYHLHVPVLPWRLCGSTVF